MHGLARLGGVLLLAEAPDVPAAPLPVSGRFVVPLAAEDLRRSLRDGR